MILDLFAGAGGWVEGMRHVGLWDDLGIEINEAACQTADLAGHTVEHADVTELNPSHFLSAGSNTLIEGIVASPPCQPFSENGRRKGLTDPRGALVAEPLRWVETLRPPWAAFEQVHTVLPIWRSQAAELRKMGYSTWACVLNAADYGVPQNRRRAVLLARRDGKPAGPPPETHTPIRHVSQGAALGWDNSADWVVNTGLDWKKGQPREAAQKVAGNRPASTVTTRSVGQWRVYPPGDVGYRGLHEWEAGVLQTFADNYPWAGPTQLARATQIGNAIPPLLAAHIVAEMTGRHFCTAHSEARRFEVDEHGKRAIPFTGGAA
jgi:DNA (cytosine-5)-methyltransferase 1